jgi:hypothetical protein
MFEKVTVLVVPRDRFSSVVECVEAIVRSTDVPYRLAILDFGYDPARLRDIEALTAGVPTEIVPCGRTLPLSAFQQYLGRIETPYLAWVDNDTFVTPGWLTALLDRAAQGARVILPLTLERDGLDPDPRRRPLRTHISHAELRRVNVEGVDYVFDHKPYRRAAPEELPPEAHTVDFFELHTFFAETEVMRQLDLPAMVVREHIDLGMQLRWLGIDIWCEPKAQVHFDNIHHRPTWRDLRFFFYRWSRQRIDQSHDLFDRRWGYRFYNEQFLKNWAFRRKVFSVGRFLGLPQRPADLLARACAKAFCRPIPEALRRDPLPESQRVLAPVEPETADGVAA